MTSKTNSRRTPRVACFVPARAEGPRGPLRGFCRSLSQGGLFLAGVSLPVGKSIEVSLELPAGPIQAHGEVRYLVSNGGESGMGIRFTRIAQDDLQQIQGFVAGHAP